MTTISLVMPVYNRASLVKEMIDSIIKQTYIDWELIIVDDGSEVKELKELSCYVKECNNIRIIKRSEYQKKGGQTCRNVGLYESKGEYVIFLDSDDYLQPFCLEQRVRFMEKHNDLDFAVFPYAEYDQNISDIIRLGGVKFYDDDYSAFIGRTLPFMVWSNIYRRKSLLDNLIIWDDKVLSLQDADFNMNILARGLKYMYADNSCKVDYYNRVGEKGESISKGIYSSAKFDSHIYYYSKVIGYSKQISIGKKPLRNCFLYLYDAMITNYSPKHADKLIQLCKHDKVFYSATLVKDFIFRYVLRFIHISPKFCRWLLFPSLSYDRKLILKAYNSRTMELLNNRI